MSSNRILGIALAFVASAGGISAQDRVVSEPVPGGQPDISALLMESPSSPRFWGSSEYLYWWTQRQTVPSPVLSTGPLGTTGTAILLGNNAPFDAQPHHGGRFTLGMALGSERRFGIEANYFFLSQQTDNKSDIASGAPGSTGTGNPYAFPSPGGGTPESFFTLAIPGAFSSVTTLSLSTRLQGTELNGLYNLRATANRRFDLLVGARYLDLQESLNLHTASPTIPPTIQNDYTINDTFATRNQFVGGQLGARFEASRGLFFINGTCKIAIGNVHQDIDVSGSFRQVTPAFDRTYLGGVYALPTNIGSHTRNTFAWMPEVNLNFGVNLTQHVRLYTGYNFLWINNVVRPGDQIDRTINPSQFFGGTLAGMPRPVVSFNDTSFWAQGITLGLDIRY